MKFAYLLRFGAASLLLTSSLSAAQSQDGKPTPEQKNAAGQAPVKLIRMPPVWPSGDAASKHIEGRVTLRIVIDANGKVTNSEALSGPPELFQAAIDSTKLWQFEPPASAPVVEIAEVSYGFPKECPGPISDSGEVGSGGWLRSKNGTVISWDGSARTPMPPYFDEDRRAGIAGVMRLAITVSAEGRVTKIHVVNSLSPRLDKAAVKAIRGWRFNLVRGNPTSLPDEFELPITYRPLCDPQF